MQQRWFLVGSVLAALVIAGTVSVQASERFPALIQLPLGWLPEGVVTGRGPVIYSGSRANGAIYAADIRTGEGAILVPGAEGRIAVGLSFDRRSNYIFAAGGPNGDAYVHDATTGATVGHYVFARDAASVPTFVNDVIVTRDAAYFTDSARPVLYRLRLGSGGSLPAPDQVEIIPLSGDWQQVAGFNANGIEATPNGKWLIIVNSTSGILYRVDPDTGEASSIDLGGASVSAGDGILLQGHTLYVVRNRLNQIDVVKLASDLSAGSVVDTITDADFDIPTTVAAFGNKLYAVNARFTTRPTPTTPYAIVQVTR